MIVVVAAILVDSLRAPRRVLAARRSVRASSTGSRGWELPGGKIEVGEEPIAALRRELAEELRVTIDVGQELRNANDSTWPIDEHFVMRTWFAEVTEGVPTPTGSHDRVLWLNPSAVLSVEWLPADRPVVEALRPWLAEQRCAVDQE